MATTTRKTAKYYRDILNGNNIYKSLEVIPEIMKKFGFVDEYRTEINFPRDVVHDNFNWNHSIEGFDLAKDGTLYAKVYWQGDSTDGTEYVAARYLIGGYTIKAEWDNGCCGKTPQGNQGDNSITFCRPYQSEEEVSREPPLCDALI